MDRIERTIDVAKALNAYNTGSLQDYEFIEKVCLYFDYVKDKELSDADRSFLLMLANKTGIPHYYDMLVHSQESESLYFEEEELKLSTFASFLYESSLYTDDKSKLHRYQKQILQGFQPGKRNRYFLSASTSFGKTHLTYEVVKKMKYQNVILIFPTIALLTENLSRLKEKDTYEYFEDNNYAIHTLSDGKEGYREKNIFIFTPERYLSFLDKRGATLAIDFVFVDEVYKIDNEYMDNDQQEVKEHDRDLAYRMAIYYALLNTGVDLLLAGPYISFYNPSQDGYNDSFNLFLEHYDITLINKNDYEIVGKSYDIVKTRQRQEINGISIDFTENGENVKTKAGRLRILLGHFFSYKPLAEHKTIVYCSRKVTVEDYATQILSWGQVQVPEGEEFGLFIKHLERIYHQDWCVTRALKGGVGIHHGVVPKYIQKEIVKLFNAREHGLTVLVCTTTITEGVNTSAKNLIALFDKKGNKPLKAFDAKNIAGRAGRFMEHYQGSVITIQNDFDKVINSDDGGIKHKNFDADTPKDGPDLDMTDDNYLGEGGREKKLRISELQQNRGIPEEIMQMFKAVSREDKIRVFDGINALGPVALLQIEALIERSLQNQIEYEGFQIFIDVITPVVRDKNFLHLLGKASYMLEGVLIEQDYSRITNALYWYLKDGFKGLFTFRVERLGEDVDTAMRRASELVYNTFKYQLVKYLGVFNMMYKYYITQATNQPFEEVKGVDRLLTKLEYNAFSDKAKIASDYGVPQRVIDYYDAASEGGRQRIRNTFDAFENHIFLTTRKLFDV